MIIDECGEVWTVRIGRKKGNFYRRRAPIPLCQKKTLLDL
jgi:hypothetical protein